MRKKVADNFWEWVEKTNDGCWIWKRALTNKGYGNLFWNGKNASAHRIAWELTYGKIANGLCVLHKCDNPSCVNPDHLWLGTKSDNSLDCSRKGRRYKIPKSCMRRGEEHGMAKLTNSQVILIRQKYMTGKTTFTQLAEEFGVSFQTICNAIYEYTYRNVPGVFNES